MAISRKNFNALADIVNDHRDRIEGYDERPSPLTLSDAALRLANAIADHCEDENPAFKRDYFIEGCGFHSVEGEDSHEEVLSCCAARGK